VNTNAARRARRKAIKADLTHAYSDDEAAPPEWLDLLNTVNDETGELRRDVARETDRFVTEPDIRAALDRRERFASSARDRIVKVNRTIARLNLIAPHARFTRAALDAEALLRPLFRTPRKAD
jgi:hypothetical protein